MEKEKWVALLKKYKKVENSTAYVEYYLLQNRIFT